MNEAQYGRGTRRHSTGDLGVEVHPQSPEWHQYAACRGMGVELFFDKARAEEARHVCAGCPAVIPCAAQGRGESDGMWAGQFKAEFWKRRKPGRKPKPREHGTDAGYMQHRRAGEEACTDCKRAHRLANELRREAS